MRRDPEPGPTRGDRGELSGLFVRPFTTLSQGGGLGVHDSHRAGRESWIPS
jgi:hypothetical protein